MTHKDQIYCDRCNPEFFVIYGWCPGCGRKCLDPLVIPEGKMWHETEEGTKAFLKHLNKYFKFHKDGTIEKRKDNENSNL